MLGLDEQTLERRSLARSEALFRQGEKVTAIYFVEAGRLRLERQTIDGRSLVVGTTTTGKFFVEAALFADMLNALRTDPAHAMSFLSLIAHQVIELRHRLEIMKVRSAKERVMLYLDLNAGPDGRTVDLRSQLQDIASELGLTREVLYRTLASLEQAGAIERAGARILLKNSLGS